MGGEGEYCRDQFERNNDVGCSLWVDPRDLRDEGGGMIAPMLGGMLLMINRSIPVYISVVVFVFAGFCVLLIPENQENCKKSERVIVH
ncbi:hypothetical protein C0993_011781 [Termitomyces sp. T159_Od127]|nr:hypothetical protein C0993_011781 [Termitomyces sp. T159_Od127]